MQTALASLSLASTRTPSLAVRGAKTIAGPFGAEAVTLASTAAYEAARAAHETAAKALEDARAALVAELWAAVCADEQCNRDFAAWQEVVLAYRMTAAELTKAAQAVQKHPRTKALKAALLDARSACSLVSRREQVAYEVLLASAERLIPGDKRMADLLDSAVKATIEDLRMDENRAAYFAAEALRTETA
jgi:hypothetical protein